MKYMIVVTDSFGTKSKSIISTVDEEIFTSFQVDETNSFYVDFLSVNSLTDKDIESAKTGVWINVQATGRA